MCVCVCVCVYVSCMCVRQDPLWGGGRTCNHITGKLSDVSRDFVGGRVSPPIYIFPDHENSNCVYVYWVEWGGGYMDNFHTNAFASGVAIGV